MQTGVKYLRVTYRHQHSLPLGGNATSRTTLLALFDMGWISLMANREKPIVLSDVDSSGEYLLIILIKGRAISLTQSIEKSKVKPKTFLWLETCHHLPSLLVNLLLCLGAVCKSFVAHRNFV
jgi:hypothetical protein